MHNPKVGDCVTIGSTPCAYDRCFRSPGDKAVVVAIESRGNFLADYLFVRLEETGVVVRLTGYDLASWIA